MTDVLVIPPDAERLLVQFLLAQDEVADIFDDRIYTVLPAKDRQYPLARLTLIGRVPDYPVPLHHETARLQVDTFGGSKSTARRGADTVRAAIAARISGWPHDEAVVQLATFGDMLWLPDATLTPGEVAKPRYTFDCSLRLRPRLEQPT